MKKSLTMNSRLNAILLLFGLIPVLLFDSCRKDDKHHNEIPSFNNAEVLDKWITLQLRLMRNASGIPNHGFARHFAYTGVAALESLSPTLSAHALWSGKWNGLAGLPVAGHTNTYYYPANVNAAVAAINRAMFPNASSTDKASIDSLELAFNQEFLTTETPSIINTSSNFGKAVAAAVFNWAESDGYKSANDSYTAPVGRGFWVPTAPVFANAATPRWGANRTVVAGSIEGAHPAPPPPYSTDPASPFYQIVKQVYDISQNLTDDQKAMALFWRDVPGATSPGHWLSIVQQLIRKMDTRLDKAALAYALTGAAINDGLICCFKSKYEYNLIRPITYIREVMGQSTWSPVIGTPATPEYSSAHASLSGAAAAILEKLFGNTGSFTDHTYDYLGFAPRTYTTLKAAGEEAGLLRLYAGIHYQFSILAGLSQGRRVAANILANQFSQ